MARAIYETRDGRLLVGTQSGGLNVFDNGRFVRAYQKADGLPDNYVGALVEGRDGGVWIGTAAGLARLSAGRVTKVTASGLVQRQHQGAVRGRRRRAVDRHERRGPQDSPRGQRDDLRQPDRAVRCRPLVLCRRLRHGLGRQRRGAEPLRQRPFKTSAVAPGVFRRAS